MDRRSKFKLDPEKCRRSIIGEKSDRQYQKRIKFKSVNDELLMEDQ